MKRAAVLLALALALASCRGARLVDEPAMPPAERATSALAIQGAHFDDAIRASEMAKAAVEPIPPWRPRWDLFGAVLGSLVPLLWWVARRQAAPAAGGTYRYAYTLFQEPPEPVNHSLLFRRAIGEPEVRSTCAYCGVLRPLGVPAEILFGSCPCCGGPS